MFIADACSGEYAYNLADHKISFGTKGKTNKKPPGKPEGQPLIYSPGIAVPAKNIKI